MKEMTWAYGTRALDREMFKRCRRAWDLGSRARQNYEPIQPTQVFDFENSPVEDMLDAAARLANVDAIHSLRDPTRGGVATTLNEIALASEVCIEIYEEMIPVREEVKGACEILGLDPLYVANEGKLVAIVAAEIAESMVERMRENDFGRDARIIGEVKAEPPGIVAMQTAFGGTRIVDMLVGEQLPRIC